MLTLQLQILTLALFFNIDKQLILQTLLVPLGISFYTFQTMGYIIDVYRKKYPYEKNILN